MSSHWALKLIAVSLLYVFFGHPGIYRELWHRHMWLALSGAIAIPLVTVECFRILLVRFSIGEGKFSYRMLGTTRRLLSDVKEVSRLEGRVKVILNDGS